MSFVAYSSTTVSDISSNLILSVDTWYYLSTSNKTLVGGTWQTNPPTWEENKYYWQKTITTYNNGTTTETKPVCITGGTGQPGTGIEQIVEEYAISDSKTVAPKTGWQEGTAPQWEYGKYIWSRTKIVYKNPTSVVYTTPICDTAWEAVNGLEVGGRNLILNSSFKNRKNHGIYTFNGDEVTFSTNTPLNNNNSSVENFRIAFSMSDYFLKNIRGKTITISMDYYVEKPIIYGTTDPFIGIEIGLKRNSTTGGSTQYFSWYGGKTFPTNVTGKWIRYSKNVTVSDHDVTSYGVYLYMMDASGTVKFRHPKIEFGNKATDWSTAPEDAEEQIHVLTDSLAGVSSIVNKLDKTIKDKVWQDDFTTTIDNYDATVAESIRSRVTETEKSIKGITSTVKDMETTVSKKADGSTVETLNTRLTKAEQDANGFKTTVQDYFTTTDKTLNGIQSWKIEVNQKISKDGILSTVGDYYATQDELKNLNVGGNNLVNKDDVQELYGTVVKKNGYTYYISGTSHKEDGNYRGVYIPDTIFTVGESYVFSYKFTVKSGTVTKIGGHCAAFETVKAVIDGVEYKTDYNSGYPLDGKKTEHTVVVFLKMIQASTSDKNLYIQPNRQWGTNGEWNILLEELQVEKGNVKTDWSPSLKDSLDEIQVGGRNLYPNSKGDFVLKPRNDGTASDNYNSYRFPVDSLQVGETYTISADVEITHGSFNKVTILPRDTTSNTFETRYDVVIPANKRIVCTFTKTKQTTNAVLVYAGVTGSTRGNGMIVRKVKIETGNKATDWSPAPEDFTEAIAKVETIANQTKDKFTWLVKSGTSSTNFELTDRTATLVANYINLKGLVTFAGLNSDTQGKISSAYNWTSTNGGNMSKLNDMVKAWTGGAVSATTTINGGFIRTNTITAAQIAAGAIITDKLAAGSVTTDKLTTSNIVGTNGWINLRSGTFNYGNGKFVWNGSTLTVNGSGSFSGTITSSAGTIGGWSINGSSIYRGSGYNAVNSMYFGTSGLSISNKFKVDANGNVTMAGATMTGANVSGTITSSAGTIGGWSINGSSIYRGSSDYNASTGMYFGTYGLRLGSSFKVNSNGYATINGGTFTGTINAETGKISGWRLLSSRLVSLDVDVQNETDFKNKGTKAVYLAKYNYNGQGSISAIGVQTRASTSNSWVNRIDIRYDGSMVFKNQNDVIVTKFENGNWSDIGTISCNDVIVKQNAKSYKLSHRMLVCDDTANVLGVGMTTSGDRFVPMKDKKADYAHDKIAIGSNQNRFSEIWSVKALNTTSDRNLKTNMSPFDMRYENFFMDLNTCTFMYKNFSYDDSHDRLHWGIDAQQAEQALIKNNITINEAGFLCIDHLEYPNAAGQMKEYSVRYSELIGLNIHMIQKNYTRIKELEKRNQELEKRIALLETRLK